MLAEHVFIDAGLVPLAVEVAFGDEFAQIVEALVRGGQQGEVGSSFAAWHLLLLVHGAWREVDLAAEDGLHDFGELLRRGFFALFELGLRFGRRHVKVDGSKEVPVIGEAHGRHAELLRLLHQLLDPHRAVEQRVFGVQMEMNEGGRHEGKDE